ncbi:hypothetical protein [Halobacterium rubrum]|uniref:hypothetical protein n=1 Tax=Halobacterium TaxID=2239 RepID=UPI001F23D9BA|nr:MULTISPECIES: hypothetical protein [Halobacterium]MDH5020363.1 hypothetical protein [Halobacterium rubrum]
MTRSRNSAGEQSPSSLITDSVDTYLGTLRQEVAEPTFYSHQNTLQKFVSWHCDEGNNIPLANLVGGFTEHLFYEANLTLDSVVGHIYTILNYGAYHTGECPDILRMSLVPILQNVSCGEATRRTLVDEFSVNPSPAVRRSVQDLVLYLQEREYGTRTHVYVELILAATARPEQVRQLDKSDLTQSRAAHLNISDTYIVARTGLQQTRTTQLPPDVVEVLETYLQHEHKNPRTSDCQPLLTTSHGRASTSTLRRSVKQASEAAHGYAAIRDDSQRQDLDSPDKPPTVVPSDVWRVALNEVVENQ